MYAKIKTKKCNFFKLKPSSVGISTRGLFMPTVLTMETERKGEKNKCSMTP